MAAISVGIIAAIAATVLGAAAGVGGSIYGAEKQEDIADEANRINQEQAALNRAFNAEQAAITRQWTERMDNTKHQREVKDLAAAGLNTWLSAGGGSTLGRSSPASSSGFAGAQQANVAGSYNNIGQSLMNGISQLIGQEFIQEALTQDITKSIENARYKRAEKEYSKIDVDELRSALKALEG